MGHCGPNESFLLNGEALIKIDEEALTENRKKKIWLHEDSFVYLCITYLSNNFWKQGTLQVNLFPLLTNFAPPPAPSLPMQFILRPLISREFT